MENTKKDIYDVFRERDNAGDMLKMFELSLELVRKDLEEVELYDAPTLYDYLKGFINYERPTSSFIYLEEEIQDIALEFDDEKQGERVENILTKNLLTYWLASESLKLHNRARYAFDYANACRDELEAHLDFYELLELIQNVEIDENALYDFLEQNYRGVGKHIDNLLDITDKRKFVKRKCLMLLDDINGLSGMRSDMGWGNVIG